MKNYTVGLALGSGSSRGWAHIGAIEALQEAGISIDFVAGCSVGAFVGAIFSSNGLEQLKRYVLEMEGESMFSFTDLSLLRPGLLDGDKKLRELFCMHSDKKNFSELEVPLKVVAADMHTGGQIVIDSGDLFNALRASLSYPGLFAPTYHNGRWLIDGGTVDPVPVGVARAMGADIVVAVNLNSELVSRKRHRLAIQHEENKRSPFRNEFLRSLAARYDAAEKIIRDRLEIQKKKGPEPPGTTKVMNAALQIMQDRITRVNFAVNKPDILIEPRLGDLKMLDYDEVEHAISEGYIATRSKIDDILMLMESRERGE